METTPETTALLGELYERSAVVADFDGPQIEAWVSGLFALLDEDVTAAAFVSYCAERPSVASTLVCMAMAELVDGFDPEVAEQARAAVALGVTELPVEAGQIGESFLAWAWTVQAPFGRSVVLGFDNRVTVIGENDDGESEPIDVRHSMLVEIGDDDKIADLQLAGAAQTLIAEVVESDDRVVVTELDTRDALALVVAAWPEPEGSATGPGLLSNQQFVRRRLFQLTDTVLPVIAAQTAPIDIKRGLTDDEYDEANRAARSTLQAALGLSDADGDRTNALAQAWVGVIQGHGGDVSGRERDGLLWLEWADWLGVGIGLARAGAGAAADGSSFVDFVNRCPEVSSTIDKADRDYAEWAFEVAIDLLTDVGVIDDGVLTEAGHTALRPALVAAFSCD